MLQDNMIGYNTASYRTKGHDKVGYGMIQNNTIQDKMI